MIAMRREQQDGYGDAVAVIARAAAGNTCGGCASFRGDHCATQRLNGNAIEIHAPEAIACGAWVAGAAVMAQRKRRRS